MMINQCGVISNGFGLDEKTLVNNSEFFERG
jgi:hypothetical protein